MIQINKKRAHLELVNNTKIEFDKTVEFASNPHNKTVVYTFDLQRALETPVLQTSEVYYMRQLWAYNLGIYDEVKKKLVYSTTNQLHPVAHKK